MPRHYAIALVMLSALGFGSMALFANIAYAGGVSPTLLLALRFLLATALLVPMVYIRRLRLPRGRALAGFALMGMLYTLQSQSYFTALLHASSGLVGLLLYFYPVLVTLLAICLGWEKPDRRTLALLAVAIAGIAITLGGDLEGRPFGIALGLLAAAVYAIYILLGGRLTQATDPLMATLVIMATAGLCNGALALGGSYSLPGDAITWIAIAAIALFSTVIAIAAFLIGIKYVGTTQASIISTLEPVITIALGVALLGESVSPHQLIGGAMVLLAVVMLAQRTKPQPQEPAIRQAQVRAEP